MQIKYICEKSRYLKSIVDDSVIVHDQTINVIDSVSTNVKNNISTNVRNTVSRYSDDTKVRYKMDYYILHLFVLVTILLSIIITINCNQYPKWMVKTKKTIDTLTTEKERKIMNWKKLLLKIQHVIIFMT